MAPICMNENTWDPMVPSNIPPTADASQHNYILLQGNQELNEYKQELADLGIQFKEYLGESTYLCKYLPSDLNVIRDKPYIQYVDIYHPFLKIPAFLRAEGEMPEGVSGKPYRQSDKHTRLEVCVYTHLREGACAGDVAKELIARGVILESETEVFHLGFTTFATPDKFEELVSFDAVHSIDKTRELVPDLTMSKTSVNIPFSVTRRDTNGHRQFRPLSGDGEIIHIADSGFDLGSTLDVHPAFRGNTPRCVAMFVQTPADQYERIQQTHDPRMVDVNGHGTAMTCCACGNSPFDALPTPEGLPGGTMTGSAPQAQFIMTKIDFRRLRSGELSWHGPYALGARISSHSYGLGHVNAQSDVIPYGAMNQAMDDCLYYQYYDLVVTWSAGNSGERTSHPNQIGGYACSKNIITIGATYNMRPAIVRRANNVAFTSRTFREQDPFAVTRFSSRGPCWVRNSPRVKPDLCAPGSLIISADSRGLTTPHSDGFVSCGFPFRVSHGTSPATAFAAGCVALVRQTLRYHNVSNPSAPLIKALLINGAVDIEREAGDLPRIPNFRQGWGRINVEATVAMIDASSNIEYDRHVPSPGIFNHDRYHWNAGFWDIKNNLQGGTPVDSQMQPVSFGRTSSFDIMVPPPKALGAGGITMGSNLKITLVWHDPCGVDLQNFLGLAVMTSTQPPQRRHGNMGDRDMMNAQWYYDTVNNVQQVIWEGIPPGRATVIVNCRQTYVAAAEIGYGLAWSLEG